MLMIAAMCFAAIAIGGMRLDSLLESYTAGWMLNDSRAWRLVTRLQRLYRGFGFGPCCKDCVACKRDVWRVGVRHLIDDDARLRLGVQDNVKGRLCFRSLAQSGIV